MLDWRQTGKWNVFRNQDCGYVESKYDFILDVNIEIFALTAVTTRIIVNSISSDVESA
jgi:hypothetical protein